RNASTARASPSCAARPRPNRRPPRPRRAKARRALPGTRQAHGRPGHRVRLGRRMGGVLMEARTGVVEAQKEVLVFVLGGEGYAVDILKVEEIRGYDKVTPIPAAPPFLKGIVNLRGVIVPVIDLRVKFAMPEPRYDDTTVMIVLRLGQRVIGVVVDGVSDT